MLFADQDWLHTPIEYEIINGQCSYCGRDGTYFELELARVLPDENGKYPDGFWVCRHCEDCNLQIEQQTLEG